MQDYLLFLFLLFSFSTSQPNSLRTKILLRILRNEFQDFDSLLREGALLYRDMLSTSLPLTVCPDKGGRIEGVRYGVRHFTSLSFVPRFLRPSMSSGKETTSLSASRRVRNACMLLSFSSSTLLSKFLGRRVDDSFMRPFLPTSFLPTSLQNSFRATILLRVMLKLSIPVLKFEDVCDSLPNYQCHALRPLICSVPSPFGRDSWSSKQNERLNAHIRDFLATNPHIEITWQEFVRIVEWAYKHQNILQRADSAMFDLDCTCIYRLGWDGLDPATILMLANKNRLLDRGLCMYLQAKKEKNRDEYMNLLVKEIVDKAITSASSAVVPSD
jgi:hypothetical protein